MHPFPLECEGNEQRGLILLMLSDHCCLHVLLSHI